MKMNLETSVEFCDLNCKFSKPDMYVPGCHTINPIYCKKKKHVVAKSMPCSYYKARECFKY